MNGAEGCPTCGEKWTQYRLLLPVGCRFDPNPNAVDRRTADVLIHCWRGHAYVTGHITVRTRFPRGFGDLQPITPDEPVRRAAIWDWKTM